MEGPTAARRRITGEHERAELLERESELEQIGGALRSAAAGSGGIVLVEGAAGIGKSSLLSAAAGLAGTEGMTVLRARGGVLEREFALGVAIQLLAPAIEPMTKRQRERTFAGAAGLARPLFEEVPDPAAADGRLFARFHGLHWLCARLSEERPLALLVDDAHWADEHSLRFLAYLEGRIEEIPACAVLVVRSGDVPATGSGALTRLAARDSLARVRPAPLSAAAIAVLVRGGLGDDTADEICFECARATGGNPLLAHHLVAALEERAARRAAVDAGAIAAMGPPSVAEFVTARLSRRDEAVVAVAQALAVLGDDASLSDVAAVAGVDAGVAVDAVDVLIDAEVLLPELPPRFAHPIVQQALYESIPPGDRVRRHLAGARRLAGDPALYERVAAQLLAAGPAGPIRERWAFDALSAAAERADERGSPDQAARFLRRALDEAPGSLRRSTLLDLGAAEAAARLSEAAGHMEEARALSTTPAERAEAALGLSMVRFLAAELPEAVAAAEDALELSEELERELRLSLEFQALATRLVGGLPSPESVMRLLSLEDEVSGGKTAAERSLLAMMALVFAATTVRPADQVAALAEAAWGDGRLLAEVRARHRVLAAPATPIAMMAATVAIALTGRLGRAIELWSAGVEDGRSRGSMLLYSTSLGLRSSARAWIGDLAGAEADAVTAMGLLPAEEHIIRPTALSALADVHMERGSLDEAAVLLRDEWPTGELPLSLSISQALASRGRLALRRGDARAALDDLEEAGRRAAAIAYVNPCALMWRSYAALAATALGEHDRARELVEEELEVARRFGAPEPLGDALRVRALLAPRREMAEMAREAVEVLAGSELRTAHARGLIDLGAALRRGGHRRDAREPLREGLDIASRCGSTVETDRALAELRATGARPRRPLMSGVEALSAQERRVAGLAAEGRSNREIAEALFLTRRTVEMHLTSAYRKLGVSGRGDLAAALTGDEPGAQPG
jgi:DNA-binding CsgD family transcriptional regulator